MDVQPPGLGSYLRLIDSRITQLKAQGPSRARVESKEEEKNNLSTHLRACPCSPPASCTPLVSYMGASLTKNSAFLKPCSRTMRKALRRC